MSKLVLVESPFRAVKEAPVDYVVRSMRDAFARGEYPFASHRLYPGVLDDDKPSERELGINAGLEWGKQAVETIVYCDHGITIGMALGIARAIDEGRPVVLRALDRPEAVPAFARVLRLTHDERQAQRERHDREIASWCERWDAAAASLGISSDELARMTDRQLERKRNGAEALPKETF